MMPPPPVILARLFDLAADGSLLSEGARTATRGVAASFSPICWESDSLAAGLLPSLSRLLRPLHTALNACPPWYGSRWPW
jgi:ABC-type nitrate/sulfonate/bicarbonate transport system permease component